MASLTRVLDQLDRYLTSDLESDAFLQLEISDKSAEWKESATQLVTDVMSSSGTRVPVWLRYLCSTPGWGLGGVDAVWPATRVGEGSVFS